LPDEHLRGLLAGCGAEVVVGGHTHYQTDRMVAGIRALNPGSTGMPRPAGQAGWLLLTGGSPGDLVAEQHRVPYDVDAVVRDLHRRRHPNAPFVQTVLTGDREQRRTPAVWLRRLDAPAARNRLAGL
jgi:hypothetical protein